MQLELYSVHCKFKFIIGLLTFYLWGVGGEIAYHVENLLQIGSWLLWNLPVEDY